jgi:hypothetical protein
MGICPNCNRSQFRLKLIGCKACGKTGCKSCFIFLFKIVGEVGSPTVEDWHICSPECLEKIAQKIERHISTRDLYANGQKSAIRSLIENFIFSPENITNLSSYAKTCLGTKTAMHVYFKDSDPQNLHVFFNNLRTKNDVTIENPDNPFWKRLSEHSNKIKALGEKGTKPSSIKENVAVKKEYSGMLLATEVLANPSLVDKLIDKYVILFDQALVGLKFHNLNRAINVMAEKGWRCTSITSFNAAGQLFSQAFYMYALMEKI